MLQNDPQDDPDPTTLVRNGSQGPLWAQLKAALIEFILDSGMKADSRLPSEPELCRRFAVSRTVVREALNQLVVEGLIYRIQGKGTFVASRREDQDFVGTTVGFTNDFRGTDRLIHRTVLAQELRPSTPREAKFLRIGIDDPVISINRILMVDHVPRAYVETAIVPFAAPQFETTPLGNRSLYETLRRQYGLIFKTAERWIEAVQADADIAEKLDVPFGEALLKVESISFDQDDVPVEYYTAHQRTDKSRLHFKIRA